MGGGGGYAAPVSTGAASAEQERMAQAKEAARIHERLRRKKKGRRSTILTGPAGVTNDPLLYKTTLG